MLSTVVKCVRPCEVSQRRYMALSCSCRPPAPPGTSCPCAPIMPGSGRRIVPPATCTPGPCPLNPCRPNFHHGHDTYKKYKYLFFFLMLPLIITQYIRTCGHPIPPKEVCRDYEYMRIRSKRFPWGDGTKSFFHNDHVNNLSSECEPPPLDCD